MLHYALSYNDNSLALSSFASREEAEAFEPSSGRQKALVSGPADLAALEEGLLLRLYNLRLEKSREVLPGQREAAIAILWANMAERPAVVPPAVMPEEQKEPENGPDLATEKSAQKVKKRLPKVSQQPKSPSADSNSAGGSEESKMTNIEAAPASSGGKAPKASKTKKAAKAKLKSKANGKKAPKAKKAAKAASPKVEAAKGSRYAYPREGSKAYKILMLISRKEGATKAEILKATQNPDGSGAWEAFSGRAAQVCEAAGLELERVKGEGGKADRWFAK